MWGTNSLLKLNSYDKLLNKMVCENHLIFFIIFISSFKYGIISPTMNITQIF